jgi:hypothetical protein
VTDGGKPSQTVTFNSFLMRERRGHGGGGGWGAPGRPTNARPCGVARCGAGARHARAAQSQAPRSSPAPARPAAAQPPAPNAAAAPRRSAPLPPSFLLAVYPAGPLLSIAGGPFSTVAGSPLALTADAACGAPPCAYSWNVDCPAPAPGAAPQRATAAGLSAMVTTGPNGTAQINTNGLAANMTCSVAISGTGGAPAPRSPPPDRMAATLGNTRRGGPGPVAALCIWPQGPGRAQAAGWAAAHTRRPILHRSSPPNPQPPNRARQTATTSPSPRPPRQR